MKPKTPNGVSNSLDRSKLTLDGPGEIELFVTPDHEVEARELLAAVERGEVTLGEEHEG